MNETMTLAHAKRLAPWGVAFFLLLLGHVSPSSARAGCGHLVSSNFGRSLHFNRIDDLIAGESSGLIASGRVGDSVLPTGIPRRRPCSGASCSRRIPLPDSTAKL